MAAMRLSEARCQFHRELLGSVLTSEDGIPAIADRSNPASIAIAQGIVERLGGTTNAVKGAGQVAGTQFEVAVETFLRRTFLSLGHLRPGKWRITRTRTDIAGFAQYAHLSQLEELATKNAALAAVLGSDYTITPDIVIARRPELDEVINQDDVLVDATSATFASLRASNNETEILHASISCKWTIRSDRAQNSRSEALNLVRNRKGRVPHIAVVTSEPLPSRLAAVALGTGDIDCVYHFALLELRATLSQSSYADARDLLEVMVGGARLRDISDLPLDLAV